MIFREIELDMRANNWLSGFNVTSVLPFYKTCNQKLERQTLLGLLINQHSGKG